MSIDGRSTRTARPFDVPWLPPAKVVAIPGRGETFVRQYVHPDPAAPTVLMLHGWTASADLQFFTVYQAVAEHASFVAIDHRGHGRGLRSLDRFTIEDAADDAALVCGQLGISTVTPLGYSMGGPIAMEIAHRHPDLVDGIVVEATALEWHATRRERLIWRWLPFLGAILRSWLYPRYLHRSLPKLMPPGHQLAAYLPWMEAEIRRGDPYAIVEAGRALSQFDATGWASSLGRPAAMLVTTKDRLVKPRKQRTLAAALGASVRELPADHLCPWELPDQFASSTVELLGEVWSAASPSNRAR